MAKREDTKNEKGETVKRQERNPDTIQPFHGRKEEIGVGTKRECAWDEEREFLPQRKGEQGVIKPGGGKSRYHTYGGGGGYSVSKKKGGT